MGERGGGKKEGAEGMGSEEARLQKRTKAAAKSFGAVRSAGQEQPRERKRICMPQTDGETVGTEHR